LLSSFSNGQPAGESSAHPESPSGPAQNYSDYHEIPLCLSQSVSSLLSEQLDLPQLWPLRVLYEPMSIHSSQIFIEFLVRVGHSAVL
jgi:hypothetical protein